jgi:DNA-binding response OmpR family regulator
VRLLVVEDDPHIAELLHDGLRRDGYRIDLAGSAEEGEALTTLFSYDLLILDVMLPEGLDAGYRLGERLRAAGLSAPMLYLTARGTVDERVAGLEAGGDDYLSKPFAFKELRARLQALLRRAGGYAHNTLPLAGGVLLDLTAREASRAGQRCELTRKEYAVLELLAHHPGRTFTRDEIIARLWDGEDGVEPKVIDVYVSTIRRKTADDLIVTVRGVGYHLGERR